MAADRRIVVVPDEDHFKPAPIPFGVVTGVGVDNYNQDGKEYTVTIVLDKKMNKFFRDQVLEYWEDNKPKGGGDEPDNFENITRKDENGDYRLYAKTQTHFNDQPNIVPIVNQDGTKLDPEEYGMIGAGSEGRLAVSLGIYTQGRKNGVSVFLSAVKLTNFEKLEAKGGASAFGKEDGKVEATGGFKKEDEPKKKKKKKKK